MPGAGMVAPDVCVEGKGRVCRCLSLSGHVHEYGQVCMQVVGRSLQLEAHPCRTAGCCCMMVQVVKEMKHCIAHIRQAHPAAAAARCSRSLRMPRMLLGRVGAGASPAARLGASTTALPLSSGKVSLPRTNCMYKLCHAVGGRFQVVLYLLQSCTTIAQRAVDGMLSLLHEYV